jgi:hypothetical protein
MLHQYITLPITCITYFQKLLHNPLMYAISKPSYYHDTIIRDYIGVIMCFNVL